MPGRKAPEDQRREAILHAAYAVAARERLTGLTVRAVAAQARVSSGLVFFHFQSREALLVALLDWLLEHTLVAGELPQVAASGASPAERMLAAVRHDLAWLPRARARVELFFDYWVLGTRDPVVRGKIRAALDRYRDAFLPLARAMIRDDPARYADTTPEALAAVAANFVEGSALQAVLAPDAFDAERTLSALVALVGGRAGTPHLGALDAGEPHPF